MSEDNPWVTHNSKIVYQNPWIKVTEYSVTNPDGSPGIYGVVDGAAATGVVAIDDENRIYLVGQYRFPTKSYSWEIIEGGAKPNETPLQAIQRELQEEAGLVADSWQQLGNAVHLSNCCSSETAYLFLARGLSPTQNNPDNTEVLQVKCLPFVDALKMVKEGEITDAMSIIAILRAAILLNFSV